MSKDERVFLSKIDDGDFFEEPSQINLSITNVYVNEAERIVVVKFSDGEVSKATCSKADVFDVHAGFAIAVAKRLYGSAENFHTAVSKLIKKSTPKQSK